MKELRDLIRAEVKRVIAEEIALSVREALTSDEGPKKVPKKPAGDNVRVRTIRVPARTIVRLNNANRSPRVGIDSQQYKAWDAIKTLLGDKPMDRTVLAREVETVLDWQKPQGSSIISRLLEDRCLVAASGPQE